MSNIYSYNPQLNKKRSDQIQICPCLYWFSKRGTNSQPPACQAAVAVCPDALKINVIACDPCANISLLKCYN